MLKPVLTEKSLKDAKNGRYTFLVNLGLSKGRIEDLINTAYGVHVKRIWSINLKKEVKRNLYGRKQVVRPLKKVFVTLAEKEKIDLFEEKK